MDTPIIAQYYREMKSAVKSMRHGTKIPQMMAALLTVI